MTAATEPEEIGGPHPPELIADFARSLALVVRRHKQPRVFKVLGAMADHNLEQAAFDVLAQLADAPRRTGELADSLGLDVSTISRQVRRLEGQGLLTRSPHPTDARGWVHDISDAGRDVLLRQRQARRSFLNEALRDMDEAEIRTATAVLSRIAEGYLRWAAG